MDSNLAVNLYFLYSIFPDIESYSRDNCWKFLTSAQWIEVTVRNHHGFRNQMNLKWFRADVLFELLCHFWHHWNVVVRDWSNPRNRPFWRSIMDVLLSLSANPSFQKLESNTLPIFLVYDVGVRGTSCPFSWKGRENMCCWWHCVRQLILSTKSLLFNCNIFGGVLLSKWFSR
jgi:hypothetical protein